MYLLRRRGTTRWRAKEAVHDRICGVATGWPGWGTAGANEIIEARGEIGREALDAGQPNLPSP
jgi:hypothetical protein